MKVADFLKKYKDSNTHLMLNSYLQQHPANVTIRGLAGGIRPLLVATQYSPTGPDHLAILPDRELADYFRDDLEGFVGRSNVLFFPSSYKKMFQFHQVENANVLQRAEVLHQLNRAGRTAKIVVTTAEALSDLVVNKRKLVENTLTIKPGDTLQTDFISELLQSYDFTLEEFVTEPGHFSIRGSIIDVFSYAQDLPYRLERFGDEIETIRTFNPENQLSVEEVDFVSIIPNVNNRHFLETRQPFFDFLSPKACIWYYDLPEAHRTIQEGFERATAAFDTIMAGSGHTQITLTPQQVFLTPKVFEQYVSQNSQIEIGVRKSRRPAQNLQANIKPQPSYNKNFEKLADDLRAAQLKGYQCFITSQSPRQLDRLSTIFTEITGETLFTPLYLSLSEGFLDDDEKILCYTDHQLFERYHKTSQKSRYSKSKSITFKQLKALNPGDFVTHVDHGIGRFVGLDTILIDGRRQDVVRIVYRDDDVVEVNIHGLHKISKYTGKDGTPPRISKLGSPEWENKKKKAKKRVKDIAKDLIELYAKRKKAPGFSFSADSYLQAELESSFIYDDTPDQARATREVKTDMENQHPMDRLVCGDVGFGKTEVAIRAAFKAVADSKQVAVLVPTTLLVMQHFKTFRERLGGLPCNIDYLSRFKSAAETKKTIAALKEGTTDIIIGTHKLVGKQIIFKDLGLLIIDEEQKFGVKTKEKLKEMRVNVDVLTLSATPIPRTLQFSLLSARDLSIISTPPPNRQPVSTEVEVFNEAIVRDAIRYEIDRGGQVFFVHNRVKDIEHQASIIKRLVPDAQLSIAHGQMDGTQLENAMLRFVEGETDILVSTNIIESGLDISNANTIIINRAHMFGLADLHQMRGRVGRSNRKAFCYLMVPPASTLSADARRRLRTLEEFSALGDGFQVAMRDLDIRGAGNLLGGEQSGFVTDLGFDMYHKILNEAVQELKETDFKDLFTKPGQIKNLVSDCTIETDLELIIPENYVNNISERLSLYTRLDNLKNTEELNNFKTELIDRFGPMPHSVNQLLKTVKLRWMAEKMGINKISIKQETLRAYFPPANNDAYYQSEIFGHILQFVQKRPNICKLKEIKSKLLLIVNQIVEMEQALELFNQLLPKMQNKEANPKV